MVGFVIGETLQGHPAIVNVEAIATVFENEELADGRKTVTVNTLDGMRLGLLMSMDEFLEYLGRLSA